MNSQYCPSSINVFAFKGHFHHAELSANGGLTNDQVNCSLLFSRVNGGLNLR